nr:hypothetical protein [Methylomarinum sp. Ch1-1]MDP4519483.1 hypothetical protein [Methylomarinum sp. Ch1-1]
MGPSDGCNITRRAASRSKPPKPATPGATLAIMRIQVDCLSANPPYGGSPDDNDANVANVGWLREASRQTSRRGPKLAVVRIKGRHIHPTVTMPT